MNITIRHAEPDDYEAVHRILTCPRVVHQTLQLPYASKDMWKKRSADPPEGYYGLVAEIDKEIVGKLSLSMNMNAPRRSHVGYVVIAVHDDYQRKGVASKLFEAGINFAERWLNLSPPRIGVDCLYG